MSEAQRADDPLIDSVGDAVVGEGWYCAGSKLAQCLVGIERKGDLVAHA